MLLLHMLQLKSSGFKKTLVDSCQDPARSCQYLNLKDKTLLVVVNKLFVFTSVLKQNMIFQVSQWPTEWAQKFKFLQNSCRGK